jgi:hypothetical protein
LEGESEPVVSRHWSLPKTMRKGFPDGEAVLEGAALLVVGEAVVVGAEEASSMYQTADSASFPVS